MRRPLVRRASWPALLVVLACLSATACGGSSNTTATTSASSSAAAATTPAGHASAKHATGRGIKLSPALKAALVAYAACMREHGVSMPEPNIKGPGPIFDPKQVDTASPQYASAAKTCRSKLQSVASSK
jgi:hypothetical protein